MTVSEPNKGVEFSDELKEVIAKLAEPSRGAWHQSLVNPLTIVNGDGRVIAEVSPDFAHAKGHAVAGEHARLIAQAPTLLAENEKLRAGHVVLLEALKAAVAWNYGRINKSVEWRPAWVDVAEAAIKQAERSRAGTNAPESGSVTQNVPEREQIYRQLPTEPQGSWQTPTTAIPRLDPSRSFEENYYLLWQKYAGQAERGQ